MCEGLSDLGKCMSFGKRGKSQADGRTLYVVLVLLNDKGSALRVRTMT